MMQAINKRGVESTKPNIVFDYNKNMSGVDRTDQMLSYYTTPRKTVRWYLKLFFHMLDICLWNGQWILQQINKKKMTFLEFRDKVVADLVRSTNSDQLVKVTKPHFPTKLQKRVRCRYVHETIEEHKRGTFATYVRTIEEIHLDSVLTSDLQNIIHSII